MKKEIRYPKEDSKKNENLKRKQRSKHKKEKSKKGKKMARKKDNNKKKNLVNKNNIINNNIDNVSLDKEQSPKNFEEFLKESPKKKFSQNDLNLENSINYTNKETKTQIIINELTEEEKDIITKNILEDFEEDKIYFMKDIPDNIKENPEENKQKINRKKYTSIEVDENIDSNENDQKKFR